MISGAHAIIYSTDAQADRAFLRDVLKLPHVDVGDGWLIFGLPPSEVAVHPAEGNDLHELYFIADDIQAFAAAMGKRGIDCGPLQEMGVKVGLPAMTGAPSGLVWLHEFLGNCSQLISEDSNSKKNCTFDFLPVHWYDNFEGLASHIGERLM